MNQQALETCVDIALARFEYLWGRQITPMEFYQLMELIEGQDPTSDLALLAAQCVTEMDCLEDIGSEYFSARSVDEQRLAQLLAD